MKKTSKKEASLVLQDKIKSLIIKQNLKSGDLMPTENELIEQLGVSRSSLREAIKSLEALHILDIRHGVGTFVSESSLVPMIRGLSFHTQLNLHNDHNQLINILDIREILEYGFAPMVLGKISQEQTALLQKSVANMEKNAREQKFSPKDEYHIHLKLYEPLNNPLLIQYLDAFWQIYQQVEKSLPPPMIITSVEIGEKSPTSRYISGDNPIVTPKAKILIKRNVKTVTNSMAIVGESG